MKSATSKVDPRVKDILMLLSVGSFFAASLIMPGLPIVLKPFLDKKRREEENEWKKFNTWRLKQILKRMRDQRLIEIAETNEGHIVKISDRGKRKLLKFDIDNMQLNQNGWDGKWRIVIYDIYTSKKQERELFRKTLTRLKFLKLQKSVYLTPFKCHNEIEYLRQVCNVGNEVLILTVSGIENESAYKQYFGL